VSVRKSGRGGCQKNTPAIAALSKRFIFPLAQTVICARLAIREPKSRDVGAGIHLAVIVFGPKTLFAALKEIELQIRVKLFATLSRFSKELFPGTPFEVYMPEYSTLQHLADFLGLPKEETKVAFVNGLIRDMDYRLQQGDEIGLFPPIAGG
jgi:molybdopterin synthase sulfur carrier subunit